MPIGAIGSIMSGCNILLTCFYDGLILRIRPIKITLGGAIIAIVGIGFVLYSVTNPASMSSDFELCVEGISDINYTSNTRNISQELDPLNDLFPSALKREQYQVTNEDSTSFRKVKASNTTIGVLGIFASAILRTLLSLTVSGPLQDEDIFALNFWIGIITTGTSFTMSWTLEIQIVPDSNMDIILIFFHAAAVAMLSFTKTMAIKYISPASYNVIVSFDVPLMLIFEHCFLKFCYGRHNLEGFEMIGACVVFMATLASPVLQFYHESKLDTILSG